MLPLFHDLNSLSPLDMNLPFRLGLDDPILGLPEPDDTNSVRQARIIGFMMMPVNDELGSEIVRKIIDRPISITMRRRCLMADENIGSLAVEPIEILGENRGSMS